MNAPTDAVTKASARRGDAIVSRAIVEYPATYLYARHSALTTGIATPKGSVYVRRDGEDLFVRSALLTMASF